MPGERYERLANIRETLKERELENDRLRLALEQNKKLIEESKRIIAEVKKTIKRCK